LLPAEKRMAAGDLTQEKKVAMGGQLATVLLLVMLYLMIWKPGA
jgi:type II secretory pathway component PulM